MKKNKKALTLVETIVAILIISMVLVAGFQFLSFAMVQKVKLEEKIELEKNVFYFSEKLFSLIKEGGTLDYEEYFNDMMFNYVGEDNQTIRKYINLDYTSLKVKSHLGKNHLYNISYSEDINTGFGNYGILGQVGTNNFGGSLTYCFGYTDAYLTGEECFKKLPPGISENYKLNSIREPQRYGQYALSFMDFNSDINDDDGDPDGDGNKVGDDDDAYHGHKRVALGTVLGKRHLFLISKDGKTRTYFRWKVQKDEFITDDTKNCEKMEIYDFIERHADNIPDGYKLGLEIKPDGFENCRGTIEFLRLEGKDWGFDHVEGVKNDGLTSIGPKEYELDGKIDTWVIPKDFSGLNEDKIAGTLTKEEMDKIWTPIFSNEVNVSDFRVFAYPNADQSKYFIKPLKYKPRKSLFGNYVECMFLRGGAGIFRDCEEAEDDTVSPYIVLQIEAKPSWKVKQRIKGDIKPIKFNMTINLSANQ